jgi:hypothetical protein
MSSGGEGKQQWQLGLKVGEGKGVDVVKLWTQALLLEVVAKLEVLRQRWSTMTRVDEEGGAVNLLVRCRWPKV